MGFYRFCCMQSKALNSGNIISTVKLANGPNEVGKSDLEFKVFLYERFRRI